VLVSCDAAHTLKCWSTLALMYRHPNLCWPSAERAQTVVRDDGTRHPRAVFMHQDSGGAAAGKRPRAAFIDSDDAPAAERAAPAASAAPAGAASGARAAASARPDSDSDEDPAIKWRRNVDARAAARAAARLARDTAPRAGDSVAGDSGAGARGAAASAAAAPSDDQRKRFQTTCMYGDLLTLGLSRLYV
jgi:hypothetical protein